MGSPPTGGRQKQACQANLGTDPGKGDALSRVLVADDETRIVSFVSRVLSSQGWSVDGAHDGRQAVAMGLNGLYDLVILDLLMPGYDGLEVLRRLLESRPGQRVMMLSAVDEVESKVRCLDAGASDYLPKPFAVAELMARVRTQLRQPETTGKVDRYLKVGRLRLDPLRRTVETGSRKVGLSEREFLLLQYLMRHGGEVCTREELLADVWGYSFDPGSNVLEVYIARLRSKLDDDQIETVRNVGYQLLVA
jgi:DNA-binding response OmpR family regulator